MIPLVRLRLRIEVGKSRGRLGFCPVPLIKLLVRLGLRIEVI